MSTDIDSQLSTIKDNIDEIDVLIVALKEKKAQLLDQKEKLKAEKIQKKTQLLSNRDWDSEEFEWSSDARKVLKKVFKLSEFRPQQLKTINAIMSKHDVLLLAPTGGGKSLCFQLPAMLSSGLTLVISPLISLMEDQVWSLQKVGIKAELLCAKSEKEETSAVYKSLSDNTYSSSIKILYVTPERLAKSRRFMTALQKCYQNKKLDRIAVDEVHCCSQFGHDFRPDYNKLGVLKSMFPDVPMLGVTATATTKVIMDVQKMLNMNECAVFRAPFNRPNLYYHVLEKPSEKETVNDLLANLLKTKYKGESGIIYTFSIKDTEELTTELLKRDVKVLPYHASLENKQRTKVHTKWLRGDIQAVIATVAFGMGIDKPDVRFVIHHTMSKSMENFYQESGRAGRDGKPADCILLYRFADVFKITTMMFTEKTGLANAYSMVEYCINGNKCRRDLISKHFAEVWQESHCEKMCDLCLYKDKIKLPLIDIAKHYETITKILKKADGLETKLTGAKLVDAWFQKGLQKLRVEVPPPALDRYIAEQIVAYLILKEYLKEDFHFTPFSTNSYIKIGSVGAPKALQFQGARVLRIPTEKRPLKEESDDEVEIIEEERKKKRKSSSSKKSSSSSKKQKKESSSTELSEVAECDLDKQIEKVLSEAMNGHIDEKEELMPIKTEKQVDKNGGKNNESDQEVMFVPFENVIIEIDDT